MKAQLINSLGCNLGEFDLDGSKEDLVKTFLDWLPLLQDGDMIKVVDVNQTEDDRDWLYDFNNPASKHHY
jgi:hypothetical protein